MVLSQFIFVYIFIFTLTLFDSCKGMHKREKSLLPFDLNEDPAEPSTAGAIESQKDLEQKFFDRFKNGNIEWYDLRNSVENYENGMVILRQNEKWITLCRIMDGEDIISATENTNEQLKKRWGKKMKSLVVHTNVFLKNNTVLRAVCEEIDKDRRLLNIDILKCRTYANQFYVTQYDSTGYFKLGIVKGSNRLKVTGFQSNVSL